MTHEEAKKISTILRKNLIIKIKYNDGNYRVFDCEDYKYNRISKTITFTLVNEFKSEDLDKQLEEGFGWGNYYDKIVFKAVEDPKYYDCLLPTQFYEDEIVKFVK